MSPPCPRWEEEAWCKDVLTCCHPPWNLMAGARHRLHFPHSMFTIWFSHWSPSFIMNACNFPLVIDQDHHAELCHECVAFLQMISSVISSREITGILFRDKTRVWPLLVETWRASSLRAEKTLEVARPASYKGKSNKIGRIQYLENPVLGNG